jgi:hypothetical protein
VKVVAKNMPNAKAVKGTGGATTPKPAVII